MPTAAAAPPRSFSLRSARTGRLGPSPARVTVTGGELRASHSGGRNQRPSPLFSASRRPGPTAPMALGDRRRQKRANSPVEQGR